MLQEIEISNFRCFDSLKVSNFSRINLISGKNNSGKTALLEAIFLGFISRAKEILMLDSIRKNSFLFEKDSNTEVFENLFFDRFHKQAIEIKTKQSNDHIKTRIFFGAEDCYQQLLRKYKDLNEDNFSLPITFVQGCNLSSFDCGDLYSVHKTSFVGQKDNYFFEFFDPDVFIDEDYVNDFDEKNPLQNVQMIKIDFDSVFSESLNLISCFSRRSHQELAYFYDRLRLKDQEERLIEAFQKIDSSILNLETFIVGEPMIYVKRKDRVRLPLPSFGDAMQRIAEIIFCLLSQDETVENKFLIIDEIENGIHYTLHQTFWEMLWKLARELDVQIFATTHSREMIEAFVRASEANGFEDGAYFEMTRNVKTGRAIAIQRDLDTLIDGLEEGGIRGE